MTRLDRRRVLLVHPLGYRAGAVGQDISRVANLMPPLGLACLAAWVEKHGYTADIIDCFARLDADALIDAYVREQRPGLVGFSCTTSSFLDGVRIAARVKALQPGLRTVFGGPHVSALKTTILERFAAVDYGVVGEGEEALRELLASGGEGTAGIAGLVYRDAAGQARFNGYPSQALALDDLPFPAYHKLAGYPTAYRLPIFDYPTAPNGTCISSRGCPYACTYCDRSVFGRSFRYNSAAYLYEHLRLLRHTYGIRHVNFYDDNFTVNRPRLIELCELLQRQPLGLTFNCAARAEHLDADLLRLLKKAGCWMISLGVETGDPDLLSQHRQKADLQVVSAALALIKQAGIRTKALLMMGLPGETEASIQRTKEYVFAQPIDTFNLAKFTPFPGSPAYASIRDHGDFDEDWAKMDCMHFQFVPHGLTRQRLEELYRAFHREHFQRPKVLLSYMAMAWRSPESTRRFLGNLGKFLRFARTTERYEAP